MNNTSIKFQFAKYVSLNVIGMVGISLYILADTFFISKALGTTGLAALNFTLAVFSIMHGLGLMIGIGGAARYSIYKGLKKEHEAQEMLMNALYMGVTAALILIFAGIFFSTEISLLLGADDETLAYSEVYLCTLLCFSPCFLMNNIISAFVRNDGSPGICMAAMVTSSLSNILLDYVFMFILNMGMYGAVFATGLSPVISLAILSVHIRKNPGGLKLISVKPSLKKMLSLMKLGASSFITELSSAVSVVAYNFIMLKISGNTGVAAYGVVANTALVATAVFSGISQGVQPLASHEYGEGNKRTISKIVRYSLVTTGAVSVITFLSVFLFANGIADVFNSENNPMLSKLAANGLRIYFIGFLFAGFNIVTAAFFSAVDAPGKAFVASVLRSAVLIVPLVIALSLILGINGTWLSFVAAELITVIVTTLNLARSGYIAQNKLSS